jgi:uncharacterized protein
MRTLLIALLAGALFGFGLVLSDMANPARVLAFLQLGPGWDPALMFVIGGALAVTLPGFAWLARHGRPWLADAFAQPPKSPVDRRLLSGAALFGAGWGLIGYCPGPAVVAAGMGHGAALLFIPAMFLGAWMADRLSSPKQL